MDAVRAPFPGTASVLLCSDLLNLAALLYVAAAVAAAKDDLLQAAVAAAELQDDGGPVPVHDEVPCSKQRT